MVECIGLEELWVMFLINPLRHCLCWLRTRCFSWICELCRRECWNHFGRIKIWALAFDCVVNISWRERGDSIKTASTQSKAKLKSLLNTKLKAKAQISTAQFTNQAQVTEFVVNKGNGLKCLSETRIKALLDQYIQPFEDQHQGRVLWKSQKVLTLDHH